MKNKERFFWAVLVFFQLGIILFWPTRAKAISEASEKYLQILHEVVAFVQTDYLEALPEEKLYLFAIRGIISGLGDPHSRFLGEDEFRELQEETRGNFGGLGIEVVYADNQLMIVTPIDGTPAYRAGILPKDQIIEIDGKSTDNLTFQECIKRMRGEPGSPISIKVRRKGAKQPLPFTMNREIIKIDYLKDEFFPKTGIGYIRLSQFMGKESFRSGMDSILKKFREKNVKGLIIDLRSNPGGLMELAVELSGYFLKENLEIVSVRGRENVLIHSYKSGNQKEKITDIPMIVMLNNGSASASEIFSGAIQDHGRGIVLGTKSFGKGTVQNIYSLPHKTALAITVQKYYTPKGKSIHGKGISPDIIAEGLEPNEAERPSMEKIIEGNLAREFVKKPSPFDQETREKFRKYLEGKGVHIRPLLADLILKRNLEVGSKLPVTDLEFDPQLQKAIEHLKQKVK